jgi:hypothetical protein
VKRWPAFTRFLNDGRICLLNNAAERALRGIALGRKSWLFAGSDRGGERAAALYSLIVTAKLNDVDPQAWLADVWPGLPSTRPATSMNCCHGIGGRDRPRKAKPPDHGGDQHRLHDQLRRQSPRRGRRLALRAVDLAIEVGKPASHDIFGAPIAHCPQRQDGMPGHGRSPDAPAISRTSTDFTSSGSPV